MLPTYVSHARIREAAPAPVPMCHSIGGRLAPAVPASPPPAHTTAIPPTGGTGAVLAHSNRPGTGTGACRFRRWRAQGMPPR